MAFGVLLPSLFHLAGMGGPVFLPMHIPVLLAGLTLGPATGAAIGILTPLLSFILTGMPPVSPPILQLMMVELAVYAAAAGWLARSLRTLGPLLGILAPLVGAMVAGRLALAVGVWAAATWLGFKGPAPGDYVLGAVMTGLPGLALQVVVVPALARLLSRLPSALALPPEAESGRHA